MIKNNVLSSVSTTRHASSWFARSFFAGQEMPLSCYNDGCKSAGCRRTYSYDDKSLRCTRTFLDPIHVTAESRLRQGKRSSHLVVSSRSRRLSINASLSLLSGFLLWRYVSCSVCRRFLLDPLTSTLDSEAFFSSESSVHPLLSLACLCINLSLGQDPFYIPYVSSLLLQLLQGCRRHWGSRPPPRNDRGCSLFLITNTFALHHVIVRYGSLPLHVFHSLYLGALSSFGSPCPQPEEILDIALSRI